MRFKAQLYGLLRESNLKPQYALWFCQLPRFDGWIFSSCWQLGLINCSNRNHLSNRSNIDIQRIESRRLVSEQERISLAVKNALNHVYLMKGGKNGDRRNVYVICKYPLRLEIRMSHSNAYHFESVSRIPLPALFAVMVIHRVYVFRRINVKYFWYDSMWINRLHLVRSSMHSNACSL